MYIYIYIHIYVYIHIYIYKYRYIIYTQLLDNMFVLEKRCASRSLTRARFCRAGDLLEVQAHFMQRRKYTSESPYDLAKMNIVIALFEQTPDRPRLCIVSSTNIQFVVYTYIYIYIHTYVYI